MEFRKGTPSVIARLMGLDTLPPQQSVHKQQRVLSENYLRRIAYIGVLEKRSSHEGLSFRMNVDEQQEFKDVFEVPETPMLIKHRNLSVQKEKANSSSPKEFNGAQDALDSNNDLCLEYLQEPDSLFPKLLHDLQGAPSHLQFGHITVLKSLNAPNHRTNEIRRKPERITEQGNLIKSQQNVENGLVSHSHGGLGVNYSDKRLKLQLEPKKNGTIPSPTRIVVLKPNLGKAQKAIRSISPSSCYEGSQSGNQKHKDIPSFENGGSFIEVEERKNVVTNMKPSRHRSRVSREFAKEISRQMRHSMNGSSTEASRSGFRDDDPSANDEVMMQSSPNSFNWKNRYQTSFSYSNRPFFAQEAKKHLLERWKMTKRFQEVGLASRGSTLGEMLAMPDLEMSPRNLDYKIWGKHGLHNQFGRNNGDANLGSPVGISSRDGWKDGRVRNFPKSKSLSPSPTATESYKTRARHEAPHSYRYLMAIDDVNREHNKSKIQSFGQADGLKPRNSTSICEKSEYFPFLNSETCIIVDELKNILTEKNLNEQTFAVPKSSISGIPCSDSETSSTAQESQVIQDELNHKFEKDLSEQNSMVLNSSISGVASTNMVTDSVADAKTDDVDLFPGIHMGQESEAMAGISLLKDGNSSYHALDTLIPQETSIETLEEGLVPLHCPGLDPQSPKKPEEVCQPSPVSVLESPSKEEILSPTECFEGVSADLCGLRVKLQLLQMESLEEYSEGPGMSVSSEEDTGEGSVENEEKTKILRAGDSRDFSYLIDVVVEAGFHGRNLEICFKTWHSPECPISPTVFETLEKTYYQQTSWARSERRLLFDRINSGLMEILQQCMDMHVWAKYTAKRFRPWWSWKMVEEELWILLVNQEKEVSKDSSEKLLGKELRWFELGDDIDVIGGEIERMLIDELITEVGSMGNF